MPNNYQSEVKFEITKSYGVLSTSKSGWTTELNLVSWNDREPKFDIRAWSPDHTKMGKGVTLTESEMANLINISQQIADEAVEASKADENA